MTYCIELVAPQLFFFPSSLTYFSESQKVMVGIPLPAVYNTRDRLKSPSGTLSTFVIPIPLLLNVRANCSTVWSTSRAFCWPVCLLFLHCCYIFTIQLDGGVVHLKGGLKNRNGSG